MKSHSLVVPLHDILVTNSHLVETQSFVSRGNKHVCCDHNVSKCHPIQSIQYKESVLHKHKPRLYKHVHLTCHYLSKWLLVCLVHKTKSHYLIHTRFQLKTCNDITFLFQYKFPPLHCFTRYRVVV